MSALLPFPEISTWDSSFPLSSLIVALYTATSFLENWRKKFRTQCLLKQVTGVCFLWATHSTQLVYVVLYVLFPLLGLQNEMLGSGGWVSGGVKNAHCQNNQSVLITAKAQTSFQMSALSPCLGKEVIIISSGNTSDSLMLCNYVIDHNVDHLVYSTFPQGLLCLIAC